MANDKDESVLTKEKTLKSVQLIFIYISKLELAIAFWPTLPFIKYRTNFIHRTCITAQEKSKSEESLFGHKT